jgi:hypothetical protein
MGSSREGLDFWGVFMLFGWKGVRLKEVKSMLLSTNVGPEAIAYLKRPVKIDSSSKSVPSSTLLLKLQTTLESKSRFP